MPASVRRLALGSELAWVRQWVQALALVWARQWAQESVPTLEQRLARLSERQTAPGSGRSVAQVAARPGLCRVFRAMLWERGLAQAWGPSWVLASGPASVRR